MAKLTSIILILLGLLAVFLIGIKVGTNLPKDINPPPSITPLPTLSPTPAPSAFPTLTNTPVQASGSAEQKTSITTSNGKSTYTDRACGFTFSYMGSYLNSKSANGEATIITDPKNENASLAVTCLTKVPRPPVSSENIESITVSGEAATLYHDKEREIVIVKNPDSGKEILLAGTNPLFSTILKTFKLL